VRDHGKLQTHFKAKARAPAEIRTEELNPKSTTSPKTDARLILTGLTVSRIKMSYTADVSSLCIWIHRNLFYQHAASVIYCSSKSDLASHPTRSVLYSGGIRITPVSLTYRSHRMNNSLNTRSSFLFKSVVSSGAQIIPTRKAGMWAQTIPSP
jgi:hypothetical protein